MIKKAASPRTSFSASARPASATSRAQMRPTLAGRKVFSHGWKEIGIRTSKASCRL